MLNFETCLVLERARCHISVPYSVRAGSTNIRLTSCYNHGYNSTKNNNFATFEEKFEPLLTLLLTGALRFTILCKVKGLRDILTENLIAFFFNVVKRIYNNLSNCLICNQR